MRVFRRIAAWAGVAVVAATVVGIAGAGPASAAECSAGDRVPVQISTVPALANAPVSIFGSPIKLSEAGAATIDACPATIVEDLQVDPEPFAVGPRTRARYDRVFATDGGRAIAVAFHLDYRTAVDLIGVAPADIESYTLQSSTGQRLEATGEDALWLWGSRVTRSASGLQLRDIYYTIRSVMVHGTNVVNQSQVKFFPQATAQVQVELLTFRLDIQTRDRLFGFPIGRTARLEAADGTVLEVHLESGGAVVAGVPRGTYTISVDAPGLSTPRPLSVSRDQLVDLPVLTFVDIAVLLGAPAAIGIMMILVPRPALRRRLAVWRYRASGTRRRGPVGPGPDPSHRDSGDIDADTAAGASVETEDDAVPKSTDDMRIGHQPDAHARSAST